MKQQQNTLKALNLSSHKYLVKELFERVQFLALEVLFADNSKLQDEVKIHNKI